MNFIKGLPLSVGKKVIMVVVDRLTKYVHFVALKHPHSAYVVAEAFLNNIFKLHGSSDVGSGRLSLNYKKLICKSQLLTTQKRMFRLR